MSIYQNQARITSESALALITNVIESAKTKGNEITVAVVTPNGHLVGQLSTTNARFNTVEFAYNKAFTAAAFRSNTLDFYNKMKNNPEVLQGLTNRDPRFMTFAGGLPIFKDGQCIGAIGISGGTAEEDVAFAKAAIASIGAECE